MGKRKFRLKAVKNYERKKYQNRVHLEELKVSIPLSIYRSLAVPDASSEELKVSIPLSIYKSSAVPDANTLRARLDMLNMLPEGWVTSFVQVSLLHTPFFALYRKLSSDNPSVDLISVTITPDCTWSLSIGPYQLDLTHCQLLKQFLHNKLNSLDLLVQLLSQLDNITFCIGNPDEKFTVIKERHRGEFKDHSGMLL